jgi:hypothetical protein
VRASPQIASRADEAQQGTRAIRAPATIGRVERPFGEAQVPDLAIDGA